MKKYPDEVEFVLFQRDGLPDFKDCILPHVYEQLFDTENFDDEGILAVGAMLGGWQLGCVIGQIYPDDEIFIHSILVAENYRRMGIGTDLVNSLIKIGADNFNPTWGERLDQPRVFLHTQYVMDEASCGTLEAFLKSAGFTDFKEYEDSYMLETAKLAPLVEVRADVHTFASAENSEGEIEDLFLQFGVEPEMEISAFTGSKEDPGFLMLAAVEDDDLYSISSVRTKSDAPKSDYGALATFVLKKIYETAPSSVITAAGDRNLYPELWMQLAKKAGVVLKKREAGLYALISEGEE